MPRIAFPRKVSAYQRDYKPLSGSEIAPLPGAYIVSPAKAHRRIDVTVLLRSRPRAVEERHVAAEEMGALVPRERVYLTRETHAATHGADPADVLEITRFAKHHGLRVIGRNPGARTVHLAGTVAAFSRAFRTHLAVYAHARGIYRGRTGAIHIPAILQGVVEGVFGLDNRPVAKPHFRRKRQLGGVWAHAQAASFSPVEVAKLYNFPTGADGTGECIAIIELGGGFRPQDLTTYFTKLGITPPKVTAVPVNGGGNRPTGNPNGPDGEVMLDIEVAGAVAPGAKIVVYFAPNTNQGFLRAINRAVHDNVNKPSIVSISWGGPESSWTPQTMNAFNQAFQAASLMGVTVCVAAGDGGSSDGVSGRQAHVDFPASSPFVLACGGTHLVASNGAIASESVWNDGAQGGGGGGGVSEFFPLPSYQAKANVPPSVNPGNHVGRGVPDVAGDADENTGYQVRVDGIDTVIGGTSAVAPLLAGLTALLNQKLGKPVGFLNPLIYSSLSKAGAFHDIVTGNNDITGLVGAYKAGVGWDAASGFGSPDGTAMLTALSGAHAAPAQAAAAGAAPPAPREDEAAARKTKKD